MPKAQTFEFLDLVWAKLGTYPWWPGQVCCLVPCRAAWRSLTSLALQVSDPQWCSEAVKKSRPRGNVYCVHFLESNTLSVPTPLHCKH